MKHSRKRPAFLGVANIVRFNWPSFVSAAVLVVVLLVLGWWLLAILCALPALAALAASHWVYDRSGIYELEVVEGPIERMVNLTAGFDETTDVLRGKYPEAHLETMDFYAAEDHTEASVRRARALYPLGDEVQKIMTSAPLSAGPVQVICAFFVLHEIRDKEERQGFLRHLRDALEDGGRVIVTEHLRNLPNALAFTTGVFHFHSRKTWIEDFAAAGFVVAREKRHTPFVRHFILRK